MELEQLERLRSEDTPRRPMITHTIEQFILDPKPRQDKEFAKTSNVWIVKTLYLLCLIRCVNMNESGEYCRRYRVDTILSTDRQTGRPTRWNQYTPHIVTSPKSCLGWDQSISLRPQALASYILVYKTERSRDRFIFNMGIPYLEKTVFILKRTLVSFPEPFTETRGALQMNVLVNHMVWKGYKNEYASSSLVYNFW